MRWDCAGLRGSWPHRSTSASGTGLHSSSSARQFFLIHSVERPTYGAGDRRWQWWRRRQRRWQRRRWQAGVPFQHTSFVGFRRLSPQPTHTHTHTHTHARARDVSWRIGLQRVATSIPRTHWNSITRAHAHACTHARSHAHTSPLAHDTIAFGRPRSRRARTQ